MKVMDKERKSNVWTWIWTGCEVRIVLFHLWTVATQRVGKIYYY